MTVGSPAWRLWAVAASWSARRGEPVWLVSANDHVHSVTSAHYRDAAIDVHGDRLDLLAAFLERWGAEVLWNVPGHYAHVHAEARR